MYKVRFATETEGVGSTSWAPEGEDFECTKEVALERWCHLVECGRGGETVDGVVPYLVEIVDSRGEVMYAITTLADDYPVGAWVSRAA